MEKKDRPPDLLIRTRDFAAAILKLCADLPQGAEVGTVKRQLVRAATSVGANYRAARRARSRREFVSRLCVVEEETDECLYWLGLVQTLEAAPRRRVTAQLKEANELTAIIVASIRTARRKGLHQPVGRGNVGK